MNSAPWALWDLDTDQVALDPKSCRFDGSGALAVYGSESEAKTAMVLAEVQQRHVEIRPVQVVYDCLRA